MAENGHGLVRFLHVLDFFLCELYMDRTLKKEENIFAQKSKFSETARNAGIPTMSARLASDVVSTMGADTTVKAGVS